MKDLRVLRAGISEQVLATLRSEFRAFERESDGPVDVPPGYSRLSFGDSLFTKHDDVRQNLHELLDEPFHILGDNCFVSPRQASPSPEPLLNWHTGTAWAYGLEDYTQFFTIWVPLDKLDDSSGGRLTIYNGAAQPYLRSLLASAVSNMSAAEVWRFSEDLCRVATRELDSKKTAVSVNPGDCIIFVEGTPHMVEPFQGEGSRSIYVVRCAVEGTRLKHERIESLFTRNDFPDQETQALVENNLRIWYRKVLDSYGLAFDDARGRICGPEGRPTFAG